MQVPRIETTRHAGSGVGLGAGEVVVVVEVVGGEVVDVVEVVVVEVGREVVVVELWRVVDVVEVGADAVVDVGSGMVTTTVEPGAPAGPTGPRSPEVGVGLLRTATPSPSAARASRIATAAIVRQSFRCSFAVSARTVASTIPTVVGVALVLSA